MKICFWGTRGSIARPSRDSLGFGGNTSCVQVTADDGTLVVLDSGTGAWELGRHLLREAEGPRRGHLLIGHTHWDHIQGFPFFAPLFARGWTWDVYAPGGLGPELERALGGQMSYEYFPITLEALSAWLTYHDLIEGELRVGSIRVTTRYLNHPAVTLGYRLQVGGRTVVYAADHEPHLSNPLAAGATWVPVHREDRRHLEFLAGADLVIHDTQYTEAEYVRHVGWGHTPIERAVDGCVLAGVQRLALFHHDPARSDDDLRRIVEGCQERVARAGSDLVVFGAAEGEEIDLPELAPARTPSVGLSLNDLTGAGLAGTALPQRNVLPGATRLMLVDPDAESLGVVRGTLKRDGYRLTCLEHAGGALEIARKERPDLVLLGAGLPAAEMLELCRTLRASDADEVARAPVVVLLAAGHEQDIAASFEAGATDCLMWPLKPAYLRARVRGWLLRDERSR